VNRSKIPRILAVLLILIMVLSTFAVVHAAPGQIPDTFIIIGNRMIDFQAYWMQDLNTTSRATLVARVLNQLLDEGIEGTVPVYWRLNPGEPLEDLRDNLRELTQSEGDAVIAGVLVILPQQPFALTAVQAEGMDKIKVYFSEDIIENPLIDPEYFDVKIGTTVIPVSTLAKSGRLATLTLDTTGLSATGRLTVNGVNSDASAVSDITGLNNALADSKVKLIYLTAGTYAGANVPTDQYTIFYNKTQTSVRVQDATAISVALAVNAIEVVNIENTLNNFEFILNDVVPISAASTLNALAPTPRAKVIFPLGQTNMNLLTQGTNIDLLAKEGFIAAEDFGVVDSELYKGYSVGFSLEDGAKGSDVAGITVALYKGASLLATNTADVGRINTTYADATQLSSPFVVSGDYVSSTWGATDWLGSTSDVPDKAVITATFKNGSEATAENTTLTGNPADIVPVTNTTKVAYYDTIQAAIDDADAGDTIVVRSGTYVENILVNESVTLRANGDVTIQDVATPAAWTGQGGTNNPDRMPVIFITADGAKVEGFKIRDYKKVGYVFSVVRVEADNVIVEGLDFDTQFGAVSPAQFEEIVVAKGNNVTIKGNTINRDPLPNISPAAIKIEREINPGDIVGDVLIEGNVITGGPIAIRLGAGATIEVKNNTIDQAWQDGIWVVPADTTGSLIFTGNVVTNNNRSGEAGVTALKVTSKPTSINDKTDTLEMRDAVLTANPGFSAILLQWMGPVYNPAQDAFFNTIQAAIDAAADGDTIEIAAGTYDETVDVNKSLILLGANAGVDANDGDRGAETTLTKRLTIRGNNTITVDGFKFFNNTLGVNNQTAVAVNGAGEYTVINSVFERNNGASNEELSAEGALAIRGIEISAASSGSILIANNLFTGAATNVWRNSSWNSAIYLNGSALLTVIQDNVFAVTRTALNLDDFSNAVTVTGNDFTGYATHISFGGTTPTAGSYTISGNNFGPAGTVFNLSNVNANFRLDATNNTYSGKVPAAMTMDELFALESTLWHKGKSNRNGFVRILDGHVFVTTESGTLAQAIAVADAGDTVNVAEGQYTLASTVSVSKANLTIAGSGSDKTVFNVTATQPSGYVFALTGAGVTLQDIQINKTDKANQNLVHINANNVTVKNNLIKGQYVLGEGEVSRAMEISTSSGLLIEGNTIEALRQPAYINPNTTGLIKNNYVVGTRGWVVDQALVEFEGNTWSGNAVDIALLAGTTSDSPYYDLGALKAANNNANIEDQRVDTMNIHVKAGSVDGTGSPAKPFGTIQAGVAAVEEGGTVYVAAGTYEEQITIAKSVTLLGAQTGVQPVAGGRLGGESILKGQYVVTIMSDDVTLDGFEVTEFYYGINTRGDDAAHRKNITITNNYIHSTGVHFGIAFGEYLGDTAGSSEDALFENITVANNYFNVSRVNNAVGIRFSNHYNFITFKDVTMTGNFFKTDSMGIFSGSATDKYKFENPVISNNIFKENTTGINLGNMYNATFSENLFDGNRYMGAQIGILGGTVADNVFRNTGPSIYWPFGDIYYPSYGLFFWGTQHAFQVGSNNVDVLRNEFYFNNFEPEKENGARVSISCDASTIRFRDNKFINQGVLTDAVALVNDAPDMLDATLNWWGTASATEIDALVSGDVEYSPWYTEESMENLAYLPVQNTTTGRYYLTIQGAVDAASANDTIEVAAGTYKGHVTIDKQLTLKGAKYGVDARSRSGDETEIIGSFTVSAAVANVTIDGFKFQAFGGDNPYGIGGPYHTGLVVNSDVATVENNIFVAAESMDGPFASMVNINGNDLTFKFNTVQQVIHIQSEPNAAYITINNGGYGIISDNDFTGALGIGVNADASVTVTNNTVKNAVKEGIWFWPVADSAALTITGNTVLDYNAGEHDGMTALKVVSKPYSINGKIATFDMLEALVDDNPSIDSVYLQWIKPVHNTNSDGFYDSIQAAINAATAGDTITVAAGTYRENMASWKDMEITKSLTLKGAGSGQTIIELTEGKTNGVEIRGSNLSVTIEGITFTKRPDAAYASNFGLRIAETTSSFTSLVLRDVEVAYANATNIFLGDKGTFSSVTLEDVYSHHAGTWGFLSSGTLSQMTVTDSRFEYSGQVGPGHGNGFDLTGVSSNITVTGGSFSYNTQAGINMRNVSNSTFKDLSANNNNKFGIKIDQWGVGKTHGIEFENVIAMNNAMDGISIQPETEDAIKNVFITGSILTNNGRNGLNLVYIYTGSNNPEMKNITITNSNISGNGSHGVQVWSWWVAMPITETFTATHNWWGVSDAAGVAAKSSSNITVNPWYVDKEMTTLSTDVALAAVKAAIDEADMQDVLREYEIVLEISFTTYDTLYEPGKLRVASAVLNGKDQFTTIEDLQGVYNAAVELQRLLNPINIAANSAAMQTALDANGEDLGLTMDVYDTWTDHYKLIVAGHVLTNRPFFGYADAGALANKFDAKVNELSAEANTVVAVNSATDAVVLRGVLEASASVLGLSIDDPSDYYSLPEAYKNAVAQTVLNGKPFANAAAVASAFDAAVAAEKAEADAVNAVNDAAAEDMRAVLEANAGGLGLDLADYNNLLEYYKDVVAGQVFDAKTYDDAIAIRNAFAGAVAAVKAESDAVKAINNASDVSAMQAAFDAAALGLDLTDYNGLLAYYQDAVAVDMMGTYANKSEVESAFNAAVAAHKVVSDAVKAVNAASTTSAMRSALEGNAAALGLDLTDYDTLDSTRKNMVASSLIESRPYASALEVKALFDAAASAAMQ